MSQANLRCPKCDEEMIQGFILDYAQSARIVSQWAEGAPQKSFWVGTAKPEKETIPVGTFRCQGCGYLESYAHPDFAAQ